MKRKRVLIAEDNSHNRQLLVQLLEEVCDVAEAENGLEAIRMADSNPPDLILMDLSMPVLDGWQATATLKSKASTRRVPVIAVSARTMQHEVSRAHQAGVDAFVALPLDESRLIKTVRHFLRLPPLPTVAQSC